MNAPGKPRFVNRLRSADAGFDQAFSALLAYEPQADARIEQAVAGIIAQVRARGDAAIVEYTNRFDRTEVGDESELRIPEAELKAALDGLPEDQRAALEFAAERIRRYHERQRGESWSYEEADGTRLGQRVLPLDRVGLYVPGGKATYPSSVLMNAIPAQVAGVREMVMVVPTPGGERNAMVLAAAHIAGIREVWTIGGAQAVAALAYGTASIRKVDKIVGPGNAYVAEAKRRVFGTVGIDMIAGPSEIMVCGDASVSPDWIAMDLFSQAEHDEMAQSILVSTDEAWLDEVEASMRLQISAMPRRAVIEQSLADRGMLVLARDLEDMARLVNAAAPEHLELAVREPAKLLEGIRHAGAIFVGRYSSESLGDYCAGPSHVLPTMRTSRFSSPLGVPDFQKRSSLIEISEQGARTLGTIAATLARGEGLEAHARSAEWRLDPQSTGSDGGNSSSIGIHDAAASRQSDASDTRARATMREDLQALSAYHVAPSTGLIKLDTMENPYELPPALRAKLGERLAAVALNRYPLPDMQQLKAAIRQRFQVPENAGLVLGNGSDELIAMTAMACARTGSTVLAPSPSFVMYRFSAQFNRMNFVPIALDADFGLSVPKMLAAIDMHRPSLIFLSYPNNPTGNCMDDADIEKILHVAPGLVVLDEAYEPFARRTWMSRLDEFPQLAVMRTLSKWGLAGVRIGFLAAARAWTDTIEKLRPPFNISVLNEAAALFALEHAQSFGEQAALILNERGRLLDELRARVSGKGLERVYRSDANFILVRVSDSAVEPARGTHGDAKPQPRGPRVAEAMRSHGVLVKNVHAMDPSLKDCLRITVGTPEENRSMLAALDAALEEQR